MNINEEKCSICFENIENNEYILPECDHKFHINCIMTWFRTGQKSCPMCRNNGINSGNNSSNASVTHINSELTQYSWQYRRKLLNDDYKKMRLLSRKKNAPEHLKKRVKKLKKMEKKLKLLSKELSDFRKSKQSELTVSKIITKCRIINGRKWKLKRNIKNLKEYIGLTNPEIQIIIPVKVEI
tara:strand:+ start:183 stop:731 length:549 start_codon:yes stop_codon:yes gene_type:complete